MRNSQNNWFSLKGCAEGRTSARMPSKNHTYTKVHVYIYKCIIYVCICKKTFVQDLLARCMITWLGFTMFAKFLLRFRTWLTAGLHCRFAAVAVFRSFIIFNVKMLPLTGWLYRFIRFLLAHLQSLAIWASRYYISVLLLLFLLWYFCSFWQLRGSCKNLMITQSREIFYAVYFLAWKLFSFAE